METLRPLPLLETRFNCFENGSTALPQRGNMFIARFPTSGFVRRSGHSVFQMQRYVRSSERSSARADVGAINVSLLWSEDRLSYCRD